MGDQIANFAYSDGIDARQRLVEQDELRPAGQGAGDFDAAAVVLVLCPHGTTKRRYRP